MPSRPPRARPFAAAAVAAAVASGLVAAGAPARLGPASARAEAGKPSGDKAGSDAAFQRGVAAFQAGRVAEALAAFEESYRLLPRASTLYNIGHCELGLDRPVEAIDAFRRYAAAGGANPVDSFLKEAEAKVARLRLDISPPGASIAVDGVTAKPGETVPVNPGDHLVEVTAEGYSPDHRRVTAPRGQTLTVTIELSRLSPPPAPSAQPAPPALSSPPPSPSSPQARPAEGASAPPPRATSSLDALFWATAGMSAAFLITGAVTGSLALDHASKYNGQSDVEKDNSLRSSGLVFRTVADVSFGLGIAAGVTALLLSRREPARSAGSVAITPSPAPGGALLGLEGAF